MSATVSVAALRKWIDAEFEKAPTADAKMFIAGLKMSLADMVVSQNEKPSTMSLPPGYLVLPVEPTRAMVESGERCAAHGMREGVASREVAIQTWASMVRAMR